ncbi:hypothetical protein A2841_02825 [Candidatus Kaiserbacteria bacterium RIFCSPHIGHO2_01_FULL_48_10]|uniref:Uncharacterized protein n=1 Tax=Candidatus Kaiserbacteria bacterium RIFCSPHIGHO2_01_FULL_48_10 TaxID=1798476 RepID=A0A1F6C5X0_9BACT|nr:MAG: hypothetical protein A2841_02825 [Candidatus Kaiserbacteria bacterium RIFCSPHIGHO2_01_FULL_48_10]
MNERKEGVGHTKHRERRGSNAVVVVEAKGFCPCKKEAAHSDGLCDECHGVDLAIRATRKTYPLG